MEAWFLSGRIIDLILALVVIEVIALPWLLRRLGSSLPAKQLLPNIAAGAALMLAVRLSLTGADWRLVATSLSAALLAHLADLWCRLRTSRGPADQTERA